MVCNNDCVANPVLPSPRGYGWTMEDDEWIPVMTTLFSAPEAIIQLSSVNVLSTDAQCRTTGLPCTDLCSCSDEDECENQQGEDDSDDSVN